MVAKKVALITGITGQDGAILAEFLLSKNYEVHGLREYLPVHDTVRIDNLYGIALHYGDMTDAASLSRVLAAVKPHEIYNLAAQSHVGVSFQIPEHTMNVNALGTMRLLDSVRLLGMDRDVRFYQASSSEMFGSCPAPQNETALMQPCSPYGISKLAGYWTTRNHRETYGMYACNGILFNHESPIRGEEFVTRRITQAVGRIESGQQEVLLLGNLDARRDWGSAWDYMEGAWLMLQQETPDDYVLATGEAHSVREFVEAAFSCIGVAIAWQGRGLEEKGFDRKTGRARVAIDPSLYRPQDINMLLGDATKARRELGWVPRTSFVELVAWMVREDRLISGTAKSYGT